MSRTWRVEGGALFEESPDARSEAERAGTSPTMAVPTAVVRSGVAPHTAEEEAAAAFGTGDARASGEERSRRMLQQSFGLVLLSSSSEGDDALGRADGAPLKPAGPVRPPPLGFAPLMEASLAELRNHWLWVSNEAATSRDAEWMRGELRRVYEGAGVALEGAKAKSKSKKRKRASGTGGQQASSLGEGGGASAAATRGRSGSSASAGAAPAPALPVPAPALARPTRIAADLGGAADLLAPMPRFCHKCARKLLPDMGRCVVCPACHCGYHAYDCTSGAHGGAGQSSGGTLCPRCSHACACSGGQAACMMSRMYAAAAGAHAAAAPAPAEGKVAGAVVAMPAKWARRGKRSAQRQPPAAPAATSHATAPSPAHATAPSPAQKNASLLALPAWTALSRAPWTAEEDAALLIFIAGRGVTTRKVCSNKAGLKGQQGRRAWREAEAAGVCAPRTWQDMNARCQGVLLPAIVRGDIGLPV